jgi:hypothetical protein
MWILVLRNEDYLIEEKNKSKNWNNSLKGGIVWPLVSILLFIIIIIVFFFFLNMYLCLSFGFRDYYLIEKRKRTNEISGGEYLKQPKVNRVGCLLLFFSLLFLKALIWP